MNDGDGNAAATREYLQKMGWTDDRLRDALEQRVHPEPSSLPAGAFSGWCRWHRVVMTDNITESSSRLRRYLDDYDEHVKTMGEPCPACRDVLELAVREQREGLIASAARDDLQGRVHQLTGRPSLTVGGGQVRGPAPPQPRPSPVVAPSRERTWGEAQVARFSVVYPRAAGSPRSGSPDRPVAVDQEPVDRRGYPAGSRTRLPAIRPDLRATRRRRS